MIREQLSLESINRCNNNEQSLYLRLKSIYDDLDSVDSREIARISILIDKMKNRLKL